MKPERRIKIIFGLLMILTGIGIFSYPFVSNYLANRNATVAVQIYDDQVGEMEQEKIDALKEAAAAYNRQLSQVEDQNAAGEGKKTDSYVDLLGVSEALGYITIPVIDVNLPIYEGTDDLVLTKGIGHLTETSYPLGGESTHSALSGHRGLAEAELFTNLDKVGKGHKFYLHILDEVLAYEVDQVKVVEPTDISDLNIIKGQDLCTLVTCTPLGINSHRLLVRGHRVAYTGEEEDDGNTMYQSVHTGTAIRRMVEIWPWLALIAILTIGTECLLMLMLLSRMKQRMEDD